MYATISTAAKNPLAAFDPPPDSPKALILQNHRLLRQKVSTQGAKLSRLVSEIMRNQAKAKQRQGLQTLTAPIAGIAIIR